MENALGKLELKEEQKTEVDKAIKEIKKERENLIQEQREARAEYEKAPAVEATCRRLAKRVVQITEKIKGFHPGSKLELAMGRTLSAKQLAEYKKSKSG